MIEGTASQLLPGLDTAYATELLQRAATLQEDAARVVADLDLLGHLGRHGDVVQLGSSVSGLMTWRDIDFSAYTPAITAEGAWDLLRPYLIDARLDSFSFRSFAGERNPMDQRCLADKTRVSPGGRRRRHLPGRPRPWGPLSGRVWPIPGSPRPGCASRVAG